MWCCRRPGSGCRSDMQVQTGMTGKRSFSLLLQQNRGLRVSGQGVPGTAIALVVQALPLGIDCRSQPHHRVPRRRCRHQSDQAVDQALMCGQPFHTLSPVLREVPLLVPGCQRQQTVRRVVAHAVSDAAPEYTIRLPDLLTHQSPPVAGRSPCAACPPCDSG